MDKFVVRKPKSKEFDNVQEKAISESQSTENQISEEPSKPEKQLSSDIGTTSNYENTEITSIFRLIIFYLMLQFLRQQLVNKENFCHSGKKRINGLSTN